MKTLHPLALTLAFAGLGALTHTALAQTKDNPADTGAVYTMTNDPGGNSVLAYQRAANGSLKFLRTFATGGRGSGGAIDPLQSQHSLLLSPDHSELFAVNPGSGDISVFNVGEAGRLALTQRIPSGGGFPVALAERGSLLYVLNAGGAGSVNGFHVSRYGFLAPIDGASHLLSAPSAGGASLDISPSGQILAVTERITAQVDSFTLGPDGEIADVQSRPFKAQTPFSLTFTAQGYLLDTETFAGAAGSAAVSSFSAPAAAPVQAITVSAPLGATGACWVVAAKNGRNAYVSNPGAGSGTISVLDINPGTGQIFVEPNAVSPGVTTAPLDLALTQDDTYLYALTAGAGTITGYKVGSNGSLSPAAVVGAQPAASGQNGLAAY